jgi:hypothetical protein
LGHMERQSVFRRVHPQVFGNLQQEVLLVPQTRRRLVPKDLRVDLLKTARLLGSRDPSPTSRHTGRATRLSTARAAATA